MQSVNRRSRRNYWYVGIGSALAQKVKKKTFLGRQKTAVDFFARA